MARHVLYCDLVKAFDEDRLEPFLKSVEGSPGDRLDMTFRCLCEPKCRNLTKEEIVRLAGEKNGVDL